MQLASPTDGGVRGGPMTGSEVRYVDSGGVHIAYRVFGDGPLDLVLVPAFTSHLEQNHEWPGLVRWNQPLASFSRLVVFDKRSTRLSDHARWSGGPGGHRAGRPGGPGRHRGRAPRRRRRPGGAAWFAA